MDKNITEKTDLPSWDLSDLYNSTKAPEIELDLKKLDELTISFNKRYKRKIKKLSSKKFVELLDQLEDLERISGRLISFAYLNYCEKVNCGEKNKFLSYIQEKIVKFESRILFLSLEINSLNKKRYKNSNLLSKKY